MKVTRLKLANVRAIQAMEFRFQPGFNLVVGVNGVGKTTILDALAVCLSGIVNRANNLRARRLVRFEDVDIRIGSEILNVECDFEINEIKESYDCTIHKLNKNQKKTTGFAKKQLSPIPGSEQVSRPLAVLFSTNRAVPSNGKPTQDAAAGGVGAACAGALSDRRLHLREFGEWMRAQQDLSAERTDAGRMLAALENAVTRFLPGYGNLRPGNNKADGGFLLIAHGATTLPVSQLSDGERGVLAMVLDITRRLAQANPKLEDPASEAEAVVLVDEIDLHLHPKWQRQIVHNLTTAFPRCQFIATTHSPQIIGEVEHERIHIVADGEVYSPTHSFGVDSSRVLEEIMDSRPRTKNVQDLLNRINTEINADKFEQARDLLTRLIERLGENDPEVTHIRTFLDFMEDGE